MDLIQEVFLTLLHSGEVQVDTKTGQAFSILSGQRRLVGTPNSDGYLGYTFRHNKRSVKILIHRLVWLAANGPVPDGLVINHLNGDIRDNRLCNLEMTTRSRNTVHAHRVLGRLPGVRRKIYSGEELPHSKLTMDKAKEIRHLYTTGDYTMRELALKYGVQDTSIFDVIHKNTWKDKESPSMEKSMLYTVEFLDTTTETSFIYHLPYIPRIGETVWLFDNPGNGDAITICEGQVTGIRHAINHRGSSIVVFLDPTLL